MTGSELTVRQKDERKAVIIRLCIIIGVIALATVIGVIVFSEFKSYSDARMALREAKNIKMTLEMADMELSSAGVSAYDETAEGNIRKGAMDYVNRIQSNPKGRTSITGYDTSKRKILGFEYELDDYIVKFKVNDEKDSWTVYKVKEILAY